MRKVSMRSASVLVLVALVASACGLNGGDSGGGSEGGGQFEPDSPEFMVHTGPGGGSDIFVRDLIEMMRQEGIIEGNGPVRNEDAGEGAGAMNHLMSSA